MPEKIGDMSRADREGYAEDEADRQRGLEAVRDLIVTISHVDPVAEKSYPSSDDLRGCVLTPAREAEARRLYAKPHLQDELVCALVNALDESRRALARVTIQQDEAGSRDADVYQRSATETAVYPGRRVADGLHRTLAEATIARFYVATKLAGEVGEVCEHIGKAARDDAGSITDDRREKLIGELGDVQWYVAALCTELGVSLAEVMRRNLAKLASRKARGVLQGSGSDR